MLIVKSFNWYFVLEPFGGVLLIEKNSDVDMIALFELSGESVASED